MSENFNPRAERVARYKDERRRQLAAQYGPRSETGVSSPKLRGKDGGTSSSSEGPRPTRASKLRLAALSQDTIGSPTQANRISTPDKSPASPVNGTDRTPGSRRVLERDKSNKRKSNLNRSLNSEEVPSAEYSDDSKSRRRRRRFFPPEILEQSTRESEEDKTKSDTTFTASYLSHSPSSPITASSPTQKTAPKKSELSVHMENARRGVTPSFSEMGKYKPFAAKRAATASPKPSSSRSRMSPEPSQNNVYSRLSVAKDLKTSTMEDTNRNIANRMEELCALTKQTLAKVERLTSKSKESPPKKEVFKRQWAGSPIKPIEPKTYTKTFRKSPSIEKAAPSSILKKTSFEEVSPPIFIEPSPVAMVGPVSILKRKVSQDDHKFDGSDHPSHPTPPVTFSPSVIDHSTSKKKQSILKKRRSLDESTVLRHRSCSPDVATKNDSRSILKNQRRSSLEELRRIQSPEMHLQGILKRKTSRTEDEDQSLNSPQGILKRRSGASSAGSTGSSPHVSITTAVILAAAGGAEMVLQQPEPEPVKPILKKKSSEDYSHYSDIYTDGPKPILKKKSSTDTDEAEEKPKPILKLPRTPLEREILDTGQENRLFKHTSSSETECEVKPILKQTSSREDSPRPRLSFCGEGSVIDEEVMRQRTSRRSNTICTDFNVGSLKITTKEEDRLLRKPRPLSVHELVMSFEQTCSTGAIPKRSSMKRNSDRYRTQPVTSIELEESRNLVKSPQFIKEEHPKAHSSFSSRSFDIHSLLDFTSSLENDNNLNSFFNSTLRTPNSPESLACGKMSSDSAFQSLGDGLELEQEDEVAQDVPTSPESTKTKSKLEPSKLETQMKAIAEEAKRMRLGKGNIGIDRYRSRKTGTSERFPTRFSTQPVTFEEVQEASKINKNTEEDSGAEEAEPSNLSLLDRIQMFEKSPTSSRMRRCRARFSTEIVSPGDITSARSFFANTSYALGDTTPDKSSDRKSILKPPTTTDFSYARRTTSPPPRSALKKRESNGSPSRKKSILKTETSSSPDKDDEGIDSASDSDSSGDLKKEKVGRVTDSTSEGESSGGREVKSIFKNENRLGFKLALESALSKSRSQGTVGGNDYSYLTPKKKVTVRRSHTENEMPRTIADLRAKLQERGESEWRKRVPERNNATDELKLLKEKNRYNDELSEKSLLASKKDELDASSNQWKSRVEKSDAEKFSVAGKMVEKIRNAVPTINIPGVDENEKKTPQAKRFKLREGAESTPTSPEKGGIFDLTRSKSVPYHSLTDHDLSGYESSPISKRVAVPNPDDITFQTFFKSVQQTDTAEHINFSQEDFDAVERQSLLVIRKNVQVQKRRGATKNPIKALAARSDITNEYTEVITGVAEREKKRLNIEKLAKNSNKALEALAGLASNEDFKSIALKKSSTTIPLLPWRDLMLLQIKGRRHVQTRLVEPIASNINDGDSFILITPTDLYNYVGQYSNVIEQSRAADIANHIQKTGDMGCKVNRVITINGKSSSPKHTAAFWSLLGANEIPDIVEAGHPNEDENFEANILRTNMIYTVDNDELVPVEKYWGSIPKVEILKETSILVFDFGSEMYVWSGKNAAIDKKRVTLKLAKELWDVGYNYSDCNICPLNIASILGDRTQNELPKKAEKRPDWSLFAKITQHRETVLFREKFLDWPDFSRVIRVKSDDDIKEVSASFDIQPCDEDKMLKEKAKNPDLIIENTHLGRGDTYFDEETRRLFEYETKELKGWRILENTYEELKEKSLGQFYDGDSYIYRWDFKQTVKGRELSGNPSKRAPVGRDRCVFFCWQGIHSSINEKGTAACLTVELDKQSAPQIRVEQGSEPAAFLRLFGGNMVISNGKRDEAKNEDKPRLFIVRGEVESEIYLMEVPLKMRSLRSRSSFILINVAMEQITVWHGIKSSKQKRKVVKETVDKLIKMKPEELYLDDLEDIDVVDMDEGSESEDFSDILGNDRESYVSLLDAEEDYTHTARLFRMSSVTGNFKATEILCLHRNEHSSPYPFVQNELYAANQPALFLIDNQHELWLWQGWWPEKEDDIDAADFSDQTGSGAVRWQAERKAAMQTAVKYWKKKHGHDKPVVAYLVWAGYEPLSFKCLFPSWEEREDVIELNKESKKPEEMLPLERELALLSRSTYPLADLLQRPLPEGVNPTNIEKYLSPEDFQELLAMSKEEFDKLPSWKKTALKKEKGLF